MIAIIIPTHNESKVIGHSLANLVDVLNPGDEIIVADGMSTDDTRDIVRSYSYVRLVETTKGRAVQMNQGAALASSNSEYLLFLHADNLMSKQNYKSLRSVLLECRPYWGWFPIELDSPKIAYKLLETLSNLRTTVSSSPLGDHGIYVKRELFEQIKGFPPIPFMEDIEFVKSLKSLAPGTRINSSLLTSTRRFEAKGLIPTIYIMWKLRLLYHLGVPINSLGRQYEDIR